jgi:hypothetical protein
MSVAFYSINCASLSQIAALANPNNESPDSYNPPRRLPKEASGIVKDGLTEVSKGCLSVSFFLFLSCLMYQYKTHIVASVNINFFFKYHGGFSKWNAFKLTVLNQFFKLYFDF